MRRVVETLTDRLSAAALGLPLVALMVLPLVALVWSTSPTDIAAALGHRRLMPALWLSLQTTLASLAFIVASGTPLAWWLARSTSRLAGVVEVMVELPIVIPPAVVGVGLLQGVGARGVLGPVLDGIGLSIPFSSTAVVLAQIVVASPFYVQAAANAFGEVEPDQLVVARTLGATRAEAFMRVAVPTALPGLVAGASLSWARGLGEFGATLLFAGNMMGSTQTLPLAIYTVLQSDMSVAVVFSLILALFGVLLLVGLRLSTRIWNGRSDAGGRR